LVDVASPSINAAVEVDGVVETGVSKKVDDHLTASAMMADNHQRSVGRELFSASRNLRHRNMQSAVQSTNIKLSRLPDVENSMPLPCAPHIRKLANGDCIGLSERFHGYSEVPPVAYTMAVHMAEWK
jgi:hypothetical protein